jgi:sterol desaturase/sphingolipid hydroxylase (fatty acid hydroxylase superfamily)
MRKLRTKSYGQYNGGWFQTGGEIVFGAPILLISVLCYYLLSWSNYIVFEFVLLVNIILGELMHSSFHLIEDATNHPESLAIHHKLYSKNWFFFKYYQYMHDLHHAYRAANFGFFDLTMDRIFGTFNNIIPNYLVIATNTN